MFKNHKTIYFNSTRKIFNKSTLSVFKEKIIAHVFCDSMYLGGGERLISEWSRFIPEGYEMKIYFKRGVLETPPYKFNTPVIIYNTHAEMNDILIRTKPQYIVDHGSYWDSNIYHTLFNNLNSIIVSYIHGCEPFKRLHSLSSKGLSLKHIISNYRDIHMDSFPANYFIKNLSIGDNYTYLKRDYKLPLKVGIVGRLSEEKISRGFLEKLKNFSDPDFIFYLVGDGLYYKSVVIDSLKDCKHIIFTGGIESDKMNEMYHKLDILLSPSYQETGGYAILEAMGTGLPAITMRGGDLINTVGFGGITCQNEDDLFIELLKFKDLKLLEEMSKMARKKIETYNFDISAQFKELNYFITSL